MTDLEKLLGQPVAVGEEGLVTALEVAGYGRNPDLVRISVFWYRHCVQAVVRTLARELERRQPWNEQSAAERLNAILPGLVPTAKS